MKAAEHLINLAETFLAGKVSVDQFADSFEGYLFDHEDEIYADDERVYNYLEDILDGISLFEPNDAIRAEDDTYTDEAQLRSKVRSALDKLSRYRE